MLFSRIKKEKKKKDKYAIQCDFANNVSKKNIISSNLKKKKKVFIQIPK